MKGERLERVKKRSAQRSHGEPELGSKKTVSVLCSERDETPFC